MIQIYGGVIYREIFKISPFRKVLENLFALRQIYKDEHNDLMQDLVKLFMNSLYVVQIRKNIDDFYRCQSQYWTQTEYDDKMLESWSLSNGYFLVEFKKKRLFRW